MQLNFISEKYSCEICHASMFIPRPKSKIRKIGHKKHIYCWRCKCTRLHYKVEKY